MPELKDGLWFLNTGESFYIQEKKYRVPSDAPFIALGNILKIMFNQNALGELPPELFRAEEVRSWMNANPPPSSSAAGTLRDWYSALARQSVLAGLNLIWRGELLSAAKTVEEVRARVRGCGVSLERLSWPMNMSVQVHLIDANSADRQTFSESWRDLLQSHGAEAE